MQAADDPQRRVLPADLARILHDLRGPLNSLTMHLEVLKRTASGDTGAEESLRTALQQLGRLAEMMPAALAVTCPGARTACARSISECWPRGCATPRPPAP